MTSATRKNNQITRFGELACLDNGNFPSVVESVKVRNPNGNCCRDRFRPNGRMKESFKVADGDIYRTRLLPQGGFRGSVWHPLLMIIRSHRPSRQNTSGATFDQNRRRHASRVISTAPTYSRPAKCPTPGGSTGGGDSDRSFLATADGSEGASRAVCSCEPGGGRANRVTVGWVSQPAGLRHSRWPHGSWPSTDPKSFTPLTKSFLPFVNAAVRWHSRCR